MRPVREMFKVNMKSNWAFFMLMALLCIPHRRMLFRRENCFYNLSITTVMTFSTFDTSHFGWCHQGHLISNQSVPGCFKRGVILHSQLHSGQDPIQPNPFLGNKRASDTIHTNLISKCNLWEIKNVFKKNEAFQIDRTHMWRAYREPGWRPMSVCILCTSVTAYISVSECVFSERALRVKSVRSTFLTLTLLVGRQVLPEVGDLLWGKHFEGFFLSPSKMNKRIQPSQELQVSVNFCYVKLSALAQSINKCSRVLF